MVWCGVVENTIVKFDIIACSIWYMANEKSQPEHSWLTLYRSYSVQS